MVELDLQMVPYTDGFLTSLFGNPWNATRQTTVANNVTRTTGFLGALKTGDEISRNKSRTSIVRISAWFYNAGSITSLRFEH